MGGIDPASTYIRIDFRSVKTIGAIVSKFKLQRESGDVSESGYYGAETTFSGSTVTTAEAPTDAMSATSVAAYVLGGYYSGSIVMTRSHSTEPNWAYEIHSWNEVSIHSSTIGRIYISGGGGIVAVIAEAPDGFDFRLGDVTIRSE